MRLVPAHVVEAMLGKVVFHPAVTGKRRSLVAVQLAVNCPVSRISVKDRRVFVGLTERLDPSPTRITALFTVLIVATGEPSTPESSKRENWEPWSSHGGLMEPQCVAC